jgi:transcriptional regulator of acetoin/glycerol metabolism
MPLTAEDRLVRARTALERHGVAAPDLVAPEITASWSRCLSAGLDPHRPPKLEAVDDFALNTARQQVELTRRLALAEMEALYQQIAGSNFLIAFAAPNGVLLDTIADASFRAAARTASIRPGTLWTETRCGTNALGTVAQIGQPLTVHGGEHFFTSHTGLTCTAAPVYAPDGSLAGVLDASSHCTSRQQHTRALVGMAATQIENGLFRQHHRTDLMVAFHSRGEYLHTLNAGLLALDPSGKVLGANPQARFLLQGLPAMPGRHFDDLFRSGFVSLMNGTGSHEYHRLEDRVGSAFVARLDNPCPAFRRPSAPALRAPVTMALVPPFVAEDPAVVAALRRVEAGAIRKLPILIRGETGTGKEQVARHAHRASRRSGPFVPLNCAALPDNLIEAELFGHADGAFTGARRGGSSGLVWEANGGTLFLDEIGDMKLPLQSVLLRLLDDWVVRPVGGGRSRQVDVLLVAATNAGLEDAVKEGRFRADLFYRLNTVDAVLPPLRERRDFAAIVAFILADLAPGSEISTDAIGVLARQPWPGNIRELRNVLTRLTLGEPEMVIGADAVAALLAPLGLAPQIIHVPKDGARDTKLRSVMQAQILAAHSATGGNLSETARRLGVSRNTVYRAIGPAPRS